MLGVFTWLGEFLYSALKFFFRGLELFFGPILAPLIPILFPILYLAYWAVTSIAGWMTQAESYLSSIKLPACNLTGLSGLELANTFFPLTETMAMLGIYLTAVMTLAIYRFIKSWIPTLS
jgi:hypothetical protein